MAEDDESHADSSAQQGRAAWDLVVDAQVEKVGLSFYTMQHPAPLVVKNVQSNSWASSRGIHENDQVTLVNDRRPQEMTREEFLENMKARPLRMKFERGPDEEFELQKLVIMDPQRKVGIQPAAVPPSAVIVKRIAPSSWAEENGLKKGDELLELAGVPVSNMQADEFHATLKGKRPLQMLFRCKKDYDVVRLMVGPEHKRLGMQPTAFPPANVFVRDIRPDSWAEMNGIRPGNELLEINGTDINQMDRETFESAMRERPVELVIKRRRVASSRATSPSAGERSEHSRTFSPSSVESVEDPASSVHVAVAYPPVDTVLIADTMIPEAPTAAWEDTPAGSEVVELSSPPTPMKYAAPVKQARAIPSRGPADLLKGQGRRLEVTLMRASGLRAADWNLRGTGKSDPFCCCEFEGRPETKVQTRYIEKTLDPVWDEKYEMTEWDGEALLFTVWDYDKGSAPDSLGRIIVDSSRFAQGHFEDDLDLLDCGKGKHAVLRVKITLLEPVQPPAPAVSESGSRLQITMICANGLRAADWSMTGNSKSDPYCTVCIEGRPDTAIKTKHISKTLDPEWNEMHVLDYYERGENLCFQVYDHDRAGSHDTLGNVILKAGEFDREEGYYGVLKLRECGKDKQATLTVMVDVLPPKREDAPPVSELGSRLQVDIISASGLRAADWSLLGKGSSDPFCVCEIEDVPDSKVETRYIAKTLDPEWKEQFIIEGYDRGKSLLFHVFDHDRGSQTDSLGKVTLPWKEFDRADGFDDELRLRDAGDKIEARLKVQIKVLPPARPAAPPISELGSRLAVTILRAQGLRAADWSLMGKGSSDPFAVCEIVGKPDTTVQTKTIMKNLDPEWNETFVINDYERGEDLEFKVFDYDRGSSADLLGRVKLVGHEFDRADGYIGQLKLLESGKANTAFLFVEVGVLPPARPPAPPVSEPGSRVQITFVKAKGLRAADWSLIGTGKSDPYCCCWIEGRKSDTMVQTRHIDKTLEPEWNETHIIEDFERGDRLQLEVYDFDRGKSHDMLGRVILPTGEFDRKDGYGGTLNLKECGKGITASLTIRVKMLPPARPPAPPIFQPGSTLRITMVGAGGLRAADWSLTGASTSDPYCVVQIPGKPDTACQTKHISRTLEPRWNEEHVIDEYAPGDPLEFVVFDHDLGKSSDMLGKYVLPAREFDREDGFNGVVNLRECGKDKKATLTIKVQVVLPRPPAPPISLPGGRLLVQIVSASGLRAADWNIRGSSSDPLCLCMVEGQPETEIQTNYVRRNLDPTWDEEFTIDRYEQGKDLVFTVKDYDRLSADDVLGWAKLPCGEFDREDGFDNELRLKDCGKGKKARLYVRVNVLPPPRTGPPVSEEGSRLKILVHGAAGLRAADVGGKSDPYCCCNVQGKPDTFFETQVIMKNLCPIWNEEHEIDDFERGDNLEFFIKDWDRVSGDDFLGRATLRSEEFDQEGGFQGELRLKESGKGSKAVLRVKVEVLPPSRPLMPPISEPGSRLRILFHSASGLRAADMNGTSDPYVTCEMQGRPDNQIRTDHILKTLSPVWNSTHELAEYEPGRKLEFKVLDYDKMSGADLLGRIVLHPREFDREDGYRGELKLKECGKGNVAMLRVAIEVLGPVNSEQLVVQVSHVTKSPLAPCDGSSLYFCRCFISKRPRSWFQTQATTNDDIGDVAWRETHGIMSCVDGDAAEFHFIGWDETRLVEVPIAKAVVATEHFLNNGGFNGELELLDTSGRDGDKADGASRAVGRLCVRIETATDYRTRVEREAKEEAERLERERIEREEAERKAKEEAERKAREEKERKEAEEAEKRRRAEMARRLRATDINVPLFLAPKKDKLACLKMKYGNTVHELEQTAIRICKLPLRPKLSVEGKLLPVAETLVESGYQEGQEVLADVTGILTTSRDKTCKIWNAGTGQCVGTLSGHDDVVHHAVSTPDLKYVVTSSGDHTAKIWAVDRWDNLIRCTMTLRGHTDAVVFAAFSPDQRWIATCSTDRTVKIWSMRTGLCHRTLDGHNGEVREAEFLPDDVEEDGETETYLVRTKARDMPHPTVKVTEMKTGIVNSSEPWEEPTGSIVAVSPDGKLRVEVNGDPMLEIVDTSTGKAVDILDGHSHEIVYVKFVALAPKVLPAAVQDMSSSMERTRLPDVNSNSRRRPDTGTMQLSASVGSLGASGGMKFSSSQSASGRYIRPQRKEMMHGRAGVRSQAAFP